MRRIMALAVVFSVFAMSLLIGSQSASAHEHRTVLNGKYEIVLGWKVEPAVSGEVNSIDLRVADLAQATPAAADGGDPTSAPVEGLETTLQADVIFEDQTRTLTLSPRWQTPGAYDSYVIPVVPGDYIFRVYGTINGEAIDELFTPGPETFSVVEDRTALEFPAASPEAASIASFGTIGGSGGLGGTNVGIGLLVVVGGSLAMAGGSYLVRRRSVLTPEPVHASSMGD